MTAVGLLRLLERGERLLCAGDVAALQRLADLIERLRQRRVRRGGGTLTAALQIAQRRISRLRIGKVSGADGAEELIERLTEVRLVVGGLAGIRRSVGRG